MNKIKIIQSQLVDLRNIINGSSTLDQNEKNFIDGYLENILIDTEYLKEELLK